ncbi:uncharacterized protein si:ch211-227n13.3 isoform X3 [Melanotaenia boesemani]|uniref:uncharacterized protein si:ch211-227n13.3 isoform X3 n=1 Tax=Melanotaenia boesemani TaxID=1250792 RepID=UPI001C053A88|nr:uncharacterized protein si:ch211-227n13.3 isoform X3 [Melanotaenia boesemani]
MSYCLKWKGSMSSQRANKLSKASKKNTKKSPKPDVEVIQRRVIDWRVRTYLNQVKADDNVADVDEEKDCYIVYTCNGKHDGDKDRGEAAEITDNGLDESDEDGDSECSSIASGPSLHHATSKKLKTSWLLCSACRKLYKMAKGTTAPVKNKLYDNDPQSLTCDQWVLIKKWMPRKLPNTRQRRLKRVRLNKDKENRLGMGATSTCSRPHIFLQRNLRQCTTVRAKKKRKNVNVRKRTRNDSQDSRNAKQQRLQSNNHHELISISCLDDSPNNSSSSWSCGSQEIKNQANRGQTAEVIPSQIALETIKQKDVGAKQEAPKKMSGFRHLLAQLRGNMIVRENC